MFFFSVADSAKRIGKDRKTIYRWIKEGKLSATIDAAGNKVIDGAELMRVAGPLFLLDSDNEEMKKRETVSQVETVALAEKIKELEVRLAEKDEAIQDLKRDKERLFLLLEDKRDKSDKRPFFKRWFD